MTKKQQKTIFLKQVKPVLSMLKKSISRKTALLDSARVESNGNVLAFYFKREPHKKSGRAFVGHYGAAVPLPEVLRGTAGDLFTDVLCCANYVENLIKAVK